MIVRWSAWSAEIDDGTRGPKMPAPEDVDANESSGKDGSWTDVDDVMASVVQSLEESYSCGDLSLEDGEWWSIIWWHDDGRSECALRRLRASWSLEEERT